MAERLSALVRGPLPAGWEEELTRKHAAWRAALEEAKREERAAADGRGRGAAAAGDAGADVVTLSQEEEQELARRSAVAPADVVSLLLVGLVRAGTHVGNSYLRRLFWTRPLSLEGVEEAAEQITWYDEDRVLLDSAVKANDGFFTSFFVSPYSKYLARWAARRGWTPNGVTVLSLAIGVLAAVAFATGDRAGLVAGAVLLQLAFTADCVDGQLARYTRTFSKLGAWLDSIFDRAKEYIVYAGLAIGASRGFGDDVWMLAAGALTLQSVRHTFIFSFGTDRREAIGKVRQPPLEQPRDADDGALRSSAAELFSPAPAAAPPTAVAAAPGAGWSARDLATRGLAGWRVVDRLPGLLWVKRAAAFPIGERFAAISITAALFDPRVTFTVLLVWGTFAALYSTAGRLLRSVR
ncbi:MAG: CDP-alcohol phosphatidyltransferase family protein [Actinobacteria bacterium]|nr:CDP-alcohol phosphatidyltransferase family protein [Actinomycetota bacterium]